MTDFVHLHVHTEYSLLDGVCRPDRLVKRAKELGQPAVAITDHGNMYGAVELYKAAKAAGVKPIIGCEVYMAPRKMTDKQRGPDTTPYHLILLCKNETGYKNLIYMVSKAWIDGYYNRPRIDREILSQHSEGLVALSACLFGEVAAKLANNDYAGARESAVWHKTLFGDDYYLEMQDQGIAIQPSVNRMIMRLSAELDIPVVATNDVHYIEQSDAYSQKLLVCIHTDSTVNDPPDLEFPTQEFYLKSGDEMAKNFEFAPEALSNTLKVAEKCNFDFEFGKTKLPKFDIPAGYESHSAYLRSQAEAGMARLYPDRPEEVQRRLDYELSVIDGMGFTDYFLIVADFISYAKSRDIPVGPGRGSGASSLVGYCMGITGIDPIRYGLGFERFLNPERVSMPDFDIDFCQERRQEVIDYVISKYGSDHVVQIVTFGTMKARAAVRDVGRALGMSYAETDTVAKKIPHSISGTIQNALDERNSPLRQQCDNDPRAANLIENAMRLEGGTRHASTHAAGVVVTDEPAYRYVPLSVVNASVVAQYTMTALEELGLLKIDFLGLRNLTVIHHAVEHIRKKIPDFSIETIPEDDPETYKMLSRGETDGVFQMESAGMRDLLVKMRPRTLFDLIAAISLYRPGPMKSIPQYLEGRADPSKIHYLHPRLESALKETHGVFAYQEQVTLVCRDLAGYSYGQADMVRRAMAKKKVAEMDRQRKRFIFGETSGDGTVTLPGAIRNGIDEETANRIFDDMEAFAGYGFNKCHAAPYALVAYQTAYLRCNFYKEYMSALISSMMGDDKAATYIEDCRRHGVAIEPPDINISTRDFTPSETGIRFGLLAVKNLGGGVIDAIVTERKAGGKYRSFYDFCSRTCSRELNSRALESLIKAGALDGFGDTRRAMMTASQQVLREITEQVRANVEGQLDLFGASEQAPRHSYKVPDVAEFTREEILSQEREITGVFLSAHPLDAYEDYVTKGNIPDISAVCGEGAAELDNRRLTLLGVVASRTSKQTKSGARMGFIRLEDKTGGIEAVFFADNFTKYGELLQIGKVLAVSGRISVRETDENPDGGEPLSEVKIIVERACSPAPGDTPEARVNMPTNMRRTTAAPAAVPVQKPENRRLYLKLDSLDCEDMRQVKYIIQFSPGEVPLYMFFRDSGKLMKAPAEMRVTPSGGLIEQLERLLGKENVLLKAEDERKQD